jgi:hypothetical protein
MDVKITKIILTKDVDLNLKLNSTDISALEL